MSTSTSTPASTTRHSSTSGRPRSRRGSRDSARRVAASGASPTSSWNERASRRSASPARPARRRQPRSSWSFCATTGLRVAASTTARAGNLWPTAELLDAPDADVVVLELTSSHLCFTTRSPTVAVVTSFWPDHLELHGSLERYRAAKEAIVRDQSATDAAVVNADDEDAVAIASLSPGRRLEFSQSREVEQGAFLRGTALVLRTPDGERELSATARARPSAPSRRCSARSRPRSPSARRPEAIGRLPQPPFRMAVVGRLGDTELVDDGMSATPTKTAAALRPRRAGSVVLVAGGELESAGLPVHASPPEQRLLEDACAEAAVPLASSSSSAPRRSGSRRCSTPTGRSWRRACRTRSPGRAHTSAAPRPSSSRRCSRCRSRRVSRSRASSGALADRPGIGRTRSSLLA